MGFVQVLGPGPALPKGNPLRWTASTLFRFSKALCHTNQCSPSQRLIYIRTSRSLHRFSNLDLRKSIMQHGSCRVRSTGGEMDGAPQGVELEAEAQEQRWLTALLLGFFASRNRSGLASRCLVETLLEMWRSGTTYQRLQVVLATRSAESGFSLLAPLEAEMLVSWVALVQMALEEVGVPAGTQATGAGEVGPAAGPGGMLLGMREWVRETIEMYRGGMDSRRLLLQQAMGESEDGAQTPPAILTMQQYTRLVITTLEVVESSETATSEALEPSPGSSTDEEEQTRLDEQRRQTSGESASSAGTSAPDHVLAPYKAYVYGFVPEARRMELAVSAGGVDPGLLAQRAAALRLLMAYIGALGLSLYSARTFVTEAVNCYESGWSVSDLFHALRVEEFVQGGAVLPLAGSNATETHWLSTRVFAHWLAIVYMTLVQVSVPFPGDKDRLGWAWVGDEEGGLEAHSLADLVSTTLMLEAQAEGATTDSEFTASYWQAQERASMTEGTSQASAAPNTEDEQGGGVSIVYMEDPTLAQTSSTFALLQQQVGLIRMTRALAREKSLTAAAPVATS